MSPAVNHSVRMPTKLLIFQFELSKAENWCKLENGGTVRRSLCRREKRLHRSAGVAAPPAAAVSETDQTERHTIFYTSSDYLSSDEPVFFMPNLYFCIIQQRTMPMTGMRLWAFSVLHGRLCQ